MKRKILELLNSRTTNSSAIGRGVIFEHEFEDIVDDIMEIINPVCKCKAPDNDGTDCCNHCGDDILTPKKSD